ncbi:MAG: hypothetical protein E7467_05050 [Ruminococcaceae bacterium]|nr:hypothetical protein [Oscillospiraceae bacterium]
MSRYEEKNPKKLRILLDFLCFCVLACLLLLITLFVRMRTMQEDHRTAESVAASEYEQLEADLRQELNEQTESHNKALTAMERKAYAAELLSLAQKAYHEGNTRKFQGYMATLEGYKDALSSKTYEIYEQLELKLRG